MSRKEGLDADPRVLFGLRLRELRKRKDWSQEDLALESTLARSYIGGVERGQRNIALINICALADTLGVPPCEMLNFQDALENAAPKRLERVRRKK